MDKLIKLLKESGLDEQVIGSISKALEEFKRKTLEESKSSKSEEEIKQLVEQRARQLFDKAKDKLQTRLDEGLKTENASYRSTLASRVENFLESKSESLEKMIRARLLSESSESAQTTLDAIAALVGGVAPKVVEPSVQNEQVEALQKQLDLLTESANTARRTNAKLQLEKKELEQTNKLLTEQVAGFDPKNSDAGNRGKDDLQLEQQGGTETEDTLDDRIEDSILSVLRR